MPMTLVVYEIFHPSKPYVHHLSCRESTQEFEGFRGPLLLKYDVPYPPVDFEEFEDFEVLWFLVVVEN